MAVYSLLNPHIDSMYGFTTGARRLDRLFSSPEPKAHGELIVYRSIRRPSVRPSVSPSVRKHFQTQISPQPVGQS